VGSRNRETDRRLPLYLVLDCSGSMAGEAFQAMGVVVRELISDLVKDPLTSREVSLSLITFSTASEQRIPLTDIKDFRNLELKNDDIRGSSALGDVFLLLDEIIEEDVEPSPETRLGDWKPIVFLFTDGRPTDDWQNSVKDFRQKGSAKVIACGPGPDVNVELLKKIGDEEIELKDVQPSVLLQWVTYEIMSVKADAKSSVSDIVQPPSDLDTAGDHPIIP